MTWAFIFYAIFINCFVFVSVLQDIMSFPLNLGHIPNYPLVSISRIEKLFFAGPSYKNKLFFARECCFLLVLVMKSLHGISFSLLTKFIKLLQFQRVIYSFFITP